jgi:hypothetical protein
MTPSLFDLPVRTGEAAAIANLVIELAASKPLTDEVRARIISRGAALKLEATKPYFASLERDPIHPSAIYLAIDGINGEPLLLRIAPATTPSSGVFPKAILIGRVPGPGGQELVINAIPFGPGDEESVKIFAEQVNRAFLPKKGPAATRQTEGVPAAPDPEAAFEEFRQILKTKGLNQAVYKELSGGIWAAIRTGWREGWVYQS